MLRHRAISLVMLFAAAPLFAQQPPSNIEDRVKQLEQRLDTLNQQMTVIRQELDALKSGSPVAATTTPGAAEDLTKVEVAQAPAASAAGTPPPTPTSIGDVTTITNPSDPGASKVFNPDTSVIGNFLGK